METNSELYLGHHQCLGMDDGVCVLKKKNCPGLDDGVDIITYIQIYKIYI
jgi:hypothetical protein